MLLALTVRLFEEIRGNVKKHVLQTLSQGIKKLSLTVFYMYFYFQYLSTFIFTVDT